ncbi:hypothetical protein PIB30_087400 [Stylosanthes scabra]|uniref:Uncharacterized protein n=1 Tax=Stylosanthes scabra TaxID=79078 RepID=A0ABU6QTN1_9FABA|nr:hypothetical protein [Stylosanthes scabra]
MAVAHVAEGNPDLITQLGRGNGGKSGRVVEMEEEGDIRTFGLNTSQPPPLSTSFHQPRTYITAAPNHSDSSWLADSGASRHITADQFNIVQHADSNQGPEQLYGGNGNGDAKEMLLKGKVEGGIYSFDNLVVSRSAKFLAPTSSSYGSASNKISSISIQNLQGVILISREPIPPFSRDNTRRPSPTLTPKHQVPQPTPNDDPPPVVTTTSTPTKTPIPISGIEIVLPTPPPAAHTSLPQPQNTHRMLTRSKIDNINLASLLSVSVHDLELKFTLPK